MADADMAAELERNQALKATLASLNGTTAGDNKAANTQAQLQINEARPPARNPAARAPRPRAAAAARS